MKQLKDADVIRIMKEEWDSRVVLLSERVDLTLHANVAGDKVPVISPGLKVKHKGSQFLYTVNSVGPRDVVLKTPEGEKFLVNADAFEKDYELS